jgi:hypothetical protein
MPAQNRHGAKAVRESMDSVRAIGIAELPNTVTVAASSLAYLRRTTTTHHRSLMWDWCIPVGVHHWYSTRNAHPLEMRGRYESRRAESRPGARRTDAVAIGRRAAPGAPTPDAALTEATRVGGGPAKEEFSACARRRQAEPTRKSHSCGRFLPARGSVGGSARRFSRRLRMNSTPKSVGMSRLTRSCQAQLRGIVRDCEEGNARGRPEAQATGCPKQDRSRSCQWLSSPNAAGAGVERDGQGL